MSRLTKAEAKKHAEAIKVLDKPTLTDDDKDFILAHWQESANHVNTEAGAFFTPLSLAYDLSLELNGLRTVIDLCAGAGTLALAAHRRYDLDRIVCVELNPAYVELGKRLLPEAEWIVGSIFDLPDLGMFDAAISNPPFGKVKRPTGQGGPRYTGPDFEYHVIDQAADLARFGAFILPQGSAPFRYSGAPFYDQTDNPKYAKFSEQTSIELDAGVGIDTSIYADDWHKVKVNVECVVADFDEARELRAEGSLFDMEDAA